MRDSHAIVGLEVTGRRYTGEASTLVPPALKGAVGAHGFLPHGGFGETTSLFEDETLFFTTRVFRDLPGEGSKTGIPRLISAGRVSRTLPIDPLAPARIRRSFGDARVVNGDNGLDAWLTTFDIRNRAVTGYLGDCREPSGNFTRVFTSTMLEYRRTQQDILFEINDPLSFLDELFQPATYGGGGGLDGDSAVTGRRRPTGYGYVTGASPVLISRGDNLYQINDGPINAVDAVYEGGVAFTATTPTADYANLDELLAASVGAGEYATCLALGVFRIGTNLEGLVYGLHVDFQGALRLSDSVFLTEHGEVMLDMIRNRAVNNVEGVNEDSFGTLQSGDIGYYDSGENDKTLSEVLNELVLSCGAGLTYDSNTELTAISIATGETLVADQTFAGGVPRQGTTEIPDLTPTDNLRVSYARTASPAERSQIAPGATDEKEAELTREAIEFVAVASVDVPLTPETIPTLPTYFRNFSDAQRVGNNVVATLAARQIQPRLIFGSEAKTSIPGTVLSISSPLFSSRATYTGLVYTQEIALDAQPKITVVSLGAQ